MIEFNNVKIFAETIEPAALEQIKSLSEYYNDCKIRIMPDVHAGIGCTIGTTMKLNGIVTANLVGVDISCGVLCAKVEGNIDLPKLDKVIRNQVPNGFNIHESPCCFFPRLKDLRCNVDLSKAEKAIGSLGGGNHFIELDTDYLGNHYLVIHSGSRNLGVQVCKYYQNLAIERLSDNSKERKEIVDRLKALGREYEISAELSKLQPKVVNKALAHLEGKDFDDYINDMKILQEYAQTNRNTMLKIITCGMDWKVTDAFQTLHNYIDTEEMILRKGAVSAKKGEILIIPMNMRDGSLICIGKGNDDWNCSAPHGAGRLMSRDKAKQTLSMEQFKDQMGGIYTTSVCESTLDEAPMAYKPMDEIMRCVYDTVEITDIIKPIYNFKAS